MSRWLLSLALGAVVLAAPAVSQTTKDTKEKKTGLAKGENLPGPFHPYNVTGPDKTRGHYHCLVTQAGLDPMVIIFVRDLDYTDSLKALEEALDNRIEKKKNVRLNSFTIFVSDELPKVVEDDDKRDKIAEDLRAKGKDLKQVIFCLDSKTDLENYKLDDNNWATIVLVNRYKVVSIHTLAKKDLNAQKVEAIMADVAEHFSAPEK